MDTATQLTLSVMYDGLFPETGAPAIAPVGVAIDLPFAIRTFAPQRQVVSELLMRSVGIEPDLPDQPMVVNAGALRRACALGTLQMVYSALAAASADPGIFTIRADLYQRTYRRALSGIHVELDTNGDGHPDLARNLCVTDLRRC